eukprot:6204967-Pleurochrysis_carterae.AAC.1
MAQLHHLAVLDAMRIEIGTLRRPSRTKAFETRTRLRAPSHQAEGEKMHARPREFALTCSLMRVRWRPRTQTKRGRSDGR